MNIQWYHKLIENPTLLGKESLKDIEDLVENFPLVENFRILYALNLLILDDYRYDTALTKAAIYSSDRRKLKEWVNRVEIYLEAEKHNDETPTSDLSHLEDKQTESLEHISKEVKEEDAVDEISSTVKEEVDNLPKDKEEEQAEREAPKIKAAAVKEKHDVKETSLSFKNETESSDLKTDKKNIRTKKELLQLVRKRLQEIEAEKQDGHAIESATEKDINARLIDRFIEHEPSISRPDKKDFYDPQNEAIESSIDEDDFFVTETLAQIHIQQGNLNKAMKIYQKLILKNPEKSSYFAAQIEKLTKK